MQAWLQSEVLVRGEKLGLTELPAELMLKKALKELYLSENALTSIPPEISNFKVGRCWQLGFLALFSAVYPIRGTVCI